MLRCLDEGQRRTLLAATVRRRYPTGSTIVFEGDAGDHLHLIAKGRVAVRVATPLGDTATLNVLRAGQSFGEQALLDEGSARSASVVALSPVETLLLHRAEFAELRRAHRAMDDVLIALLTAQVRNLSKQVLEAHYVPAEQRVARRLSDLVPAFREGDERPVVIDLTQDDIASLAGTTRSTANRALKALAEDGTIALARGRVVVADPGRLEREAYGR